MQNPFAVGQRVYLRHPTPEDTAGRWHEWFSDEETLFWLPLQYRPSSVERQLELYESSRKSSDRMLLAIVDKQTDRHIGVCNLNINWLHRHAELSIVIGEKEYRSGPYALEAITLMLRVAFVQLNLRMLRGEYVAGNDASKQIFQILRFKEVGRVPRLWWIAGEYRDGVLMALDRDEWLERNPQTS